MSTVGEGDQTFPAGVTAIKLALHVEYKEQFIVAYPYNLISLSIHMNS